MDALHFEVSLMRDSLERELSRAVEVEMTFLGLPQVYILLSSELGLPSDLQIGGLYRRQLSSMFRNIIGDRWHGPGPCVVYADTHAIHTYRNDPPSLEYDFRAVATHELAHSIDDFGYFGSLTAEKEIDPQEGLNWLEGIKIKFAASAPVYQSVNTSVEVVECTSIQHIEASENPTRDKTQADAHGPQFHRVAIHLAGRSIRSGLTLNVRRLHGYCYHSVTANECVEALADEVEELKNEPISEVLLRPAPQAYIDLWRSKGFDPK